MACIEIKNLNDETQMIPENTSYPSSWTFTGRIDMNCGNAPEFTGPSVEEKLSGEGIQWGSAIAWVTGKVGLKKCSACSAREYILNHARENGWAETFKQIKETF